MTVPFVPPPVTSTGEPESEHADANVSEAASVAPIASLYFCMIVSRG
jgi:hypothetical protein